VLIIIVVFGGYELVRRRKELVRAYRERDLARAIQIRYRTVLDQHRIPVDISDILSMFPDQKEGT
jgi:hypothetical protein